MKANNIFCATILFCFCSTTILVAIISVFQILQQIDEIYSDADRGIVDFKVSIKNNAIVNYC